MMNLLTNSLDLETNKLSGYIYNDSFINYNKYHNLDLNNIKNNNYGKLRIQKSSISPRRKVTARAAKAG